MITIIEFTVITYKLLYDLIIIAYRDWIVEIEKYKNKITLLKLDLDGNMYLQDLVSE